MPWNWELPEWPNFNGNFETISKQERRFLLDVGRASAFLKNVGNQESRQFVVEILSLEGLESSRIEGEILDRESLQSSIKQHFGLHNPQKQGVPREAGMAKLLYDVYETFDMPLTDRMLWDWHSMLFENQDQIADRGKYRTHAEPMQIVSRRYDTSKVFFEAPPSLKVPFEMKQFIDWFNATNVPGGTILGRAALAHVYFESIHPFEDGNGRIGRVLIEKVLSQGVGSPILIAVSRVLEKRKKEYYSELEKCNRTLKIQDWIEFFANVILEAQEEAMKLLDFIIKKSQMLRELSDQINPRQEKALLRMFAEGLSGFKGGLSAENYIAITKASRATASRDLSDLVQKGALVKTGQLRHTRYWLNMTI